MQAAEVSCVQYQLTFLVGLGFDLCIHRLPFVSRHGSEIKTSLAELLARAKFSIATQQNIGPTSGHIGGNGHCLIASSLGDDFRLPLVLLGIQDIVGNTTVAQQSAEELRLLDG